jgi:hypothetical protein
MNSEEVVQGMKVHSGAWLGLWSSAYHQGHIKRLVTSFQKKKLGDIIMKRFQALK